MTHHFLTICQIESIIHLTLRNLVGYVYLHELYFVCLFESYLLLLITKVLLDVLFLIFQLMLSPPPMLVQHKKRVKRQPINLYRKSVERDLDFEELLEKKFQNIDLQNSFQCSSVAALQVHDNRNSMLNSCDKAEKTYNEEIKPKCYMDHNNSKTRSLHTQNKFNTKHIVKPLLKENSYKLIISETKKDLNNLKKEREQQIAKQCLNENVDDDRLILAVFDSPYT